MASAAPDAPFIMASTAPAAPSFASTKQTTNYARLCRLLVDVGTQVLRETFERLRPRGKLDSVLFSLPVFTVLSSLRKGRALNPSQWGKLYPAIKSSVSSRDFDITLLMVLLRNICNLVPPASGWNNHPPVEDTTTTADIIRLKLYRNNVYGHANEASVDDRMFASYWKEIKDALVRLGGPQYENAIDALETECMDPDVEEYYQDLLRQWVKDEGSIKDKLDDIAETLIKKIEDVNAKFERRSGLEENVAEKLQQMENEIKHFTEKLHTLVAPKEEMRDEENTTDKFQQMEIQMKNFYEKLDALTMVAKEGTREEENLGMAEKLQQVEMQMQNVSEKLDALMAPKEEIGDDDQWRAPLVLGRGQSADGSNSRVQDREIAIHTAAGSSGSTAVNSVMNANVNPLGAGAGSAVFAGANIASITGCSFQIFQGDVKLIQNGKKGQVIETDEHDD